MTTRRTPKTRPTPPPAGGWQVLRLPVCPTCGSVDARKRTSRRDRSGIIKSYLDCRSCGRRYGVIYLPL